jgi:hypothetical protein
MYVLGLVNIRKCRANGGAGEYKSPTLPVSLRPEDKSAWRAMPQGVAYGKGKMQPRPRDPLLDGARRRIGSSGLSSGCVPLSPMPVEA